MGKRALRASTPEGHARRKAARKRNQKRRRSLHFAARIVANKDREKSEPIDRF